MSVINRKSVALATLPKETVAVEALGGEVVVRGLMLTEHLALQGRLRARHAAAGTPVEPAIAVVPELLAQTVLDDEGEPVFTVAEWETFGGQHHDQALTLFNTTMRLSGFDREAAEKN